MYLHVIRTLLHRRLWCHGHELGSAFSIFAAFSYLNLLLSQIGRLVAGFFDGPTSALGCQQGHLETC